ncbi:MAG TPA: succinate dehydrogenase assembly factor 2 [Hyphomicrobiaceae bacterium]|nr:succinate dehydrogenase assembly factor 2 [Hyphomicrobiaceae bacterium]
MSGPATPQQMPSGEGSNALDARRKRALWRAEHRGTKELDWLVGRFAAAMLAGMSEPELHRFEELLAMPEPDLEAWIMRGDDITGSALAPLIAEMRAFHGLGESK